MPHTRRPSPAALNVLSALDGMQDRQKAVVAARLLNSCCQTEAEALAFWRALNADVASLLINSGEKVHPEVY